VSERVERVERRLGADRRSGEDRRQADAENILARILRSIDGDQRSAGERRGGVDRRRFEKVMVRLRRLRRDLERVRT
jgi:hypothetical protein